MDWWNILVFGVLPVFTVAAVFFVKRRLLWVSPLISTAVSVAVSVAAVPEIMEGGEYTALFGISILIHLVIVTLLTVAAWLAARIIDRRREG